MTNDTQTHDPQSPETPGAPECGHLIMSHPLGRAVMALQRCHQPQTLHADLDRLADELTAALTVEDICPDDSSAVLLSQARILDAVFNRYIMRAFDGKQCGVFDDLQMALLAQRQSAHTIDKLKRHEARMKKIAKTGDRTKGPEKWE